MFVAKKKKSGRRRLRFVPRAEGLEPKELMSVTAALTAQVAKAASTPSPIYGYTWGWCTWYAASQFNKVAPSPGINWRGNAGAWYANASRAGWQTTTDATKLVPGAIAVWSGGAPISGVQCGHVASVDAKPKTGSKQLLIHEMNWTGFGQVSAATLNLNNLTRVVNSKHPEWNLHFVGYILPKRK